MSNRQTVVAAIVLGAFCCAVMWWLEGFRQQRMIETFRAELERLPTFTRDAQGGVA